MSVAGVNGMAVAAVAGGALLLWSGIKGTSPAKGLGNLLTGKAPPTAQTEGLQGTASAGDPVTAPSTPSTSSSGNTPAPSGITGSNEAILKQVAAQHGWTGSQWTCLYNVEMREAGFSLTATNPQSGAYGMAQFINGPSEYAQYGGNSTSALGQAVGMCNYVAQRYGTPCAAWAHEQQYGWY